MTHYLSDVNDKAFEMNFETGARSLCDGQQKVIRLKAKR
jgi:hypothetical protein